MSDEIVDRNTLDRLVLNGCSTPGCTQKHGMYLHAACHPKAALEVSYKAGSGVLHVACRKCHKGIVDVMVGGDESWLPSNTIHGH